MPPSITVMPRSSRGPNPVGNMGITVPEIQALNSLAMRGLVPMLDTEKRLFCYRLVRTDLGMIPEGFSPHYTIMTLLGLHELERAGVRSSFDVQTLFESFIRDTSWIHGAGDLGLLIWLSAAFNPDHTPNLFRRFKLESALERYQDAREGRTMELAWFLSGLSHAVLAVPEILPDFTDLAVETYHRLEENQGEDGFFGHLSKRKSVAGFLRGRIGSFADQIYPIYAMAKFATAFHIDEPLCSALECASAVCDAQGELGQWWWLYDSTSARVIRRYPVYSVHQEGMAPMALFALGEASNRDFSTPIYKGLRWIAGYNELGQDLRDTCGSLVWRCIRPSHPLGMNLQDLYHFLRGSQDGHRDGNLEVLHECRPYELGWLLYAFARRHVTPPNTLTR